MRQFLIIFSFIFILFCKQKDSVQTETAQNSPAPKQDRREMADGTVADDEAFGGNAQNVKEQSKDIDSVANISKPLDPITDASKSRLLEYTIQLNYKVADIDKTRESLLNIVKKESYISRSQTNLSSGLESMYVQIHIPVSAMYQTLIELDKIGQLTYEDIQTEDLTDKNEEQKIKLSREAIRGSRRAKAVHKGSSENWNWKDREEALERSENNEDLAKLESWKIKDRVAWAKVNITISGKELPSRVQIPNYKNAFVSAVNFLLELTYYLAWLIPVILIVFLLFKAYRRFRG